MRILILTTHINLGGISSYIFYLTKALQEREHQVFLACSGGELESKLRDLVNGYLRIPIKTKCEFHPKMLLSYFILRSFIKKKNIQIIHAQTRVTQVLSFFLSLSLGIPFVSTCHGFFKARLSRRIFPCWGRRVIAISIAVSQHLREDLGVRPEIIRVVSHGIDTQRFKSISPTLKETLKQNLGLGNNTVIGIVARLSEEKGHFFLLEAFTQLLRQIKKLKLLIVGEGRLADKIKEFVKEHNLKDYVIFFRSQVQIDELLSVMDIFVMPSLKEGLGFAIMEAMAKGLAVISSSVGGIKSLIKDKVTGILIEPASVSALKEALFLLIRDEAFRERLGANAQRFLRENFSLDKMGLATERVYQEAFLK